MAANRAVRFLSSPGVTAFTTVSPSIAEPAPNNNVQQGTKYQLRVDGTGAVSASGAVQVSMWPDGPWIDAGVMTASGTTQASDSADVGARWLYHRFNLTAISGTGAVAQCFGAAFGE